MPFVPPPKFGPELSFVIDMKATQPQKKLYFVKLGLSGQPLHHGIDGYKWVGNQFAPGRKNFTLE